MRWRRPLSLLPILLLAASPAGAAGEGDLPLAPGAYRWFDTAGAPGPIYLIVSIERQRVHVYNGDRLIGMAAVSTGMKGHRTPTGDFPILQKRQWHRSNLYSNAPMPYMQRLTWDGIALHAGHDPGYPASHGCIRLPYAFARQLFALTRIGTMVEVTQARLTAALRLDPLVLADPGSSVVSLGTGRPLPAPLTDSEADTYPQLEIDMDVFGPWGRRDR